MSTAFIRAIPRLAARDVNRAVEYYETQLGFSASLHLEDYAILRRDAAEIHLGRAEVDPNANPIKCRVDVRGIAELYERCRALGIVHANDAPGREQESLEITRKYEVVAPGNPHALHMPTHIYTRLGDWNAVVQGNLRSAEAALKYPAGDHGEFVWDQFPHAIEYLVYAYLQKGADDEAAKQLQRLRATARLEPTFITAFHLASTQARFVLERRDWNAAVLIVPREPATLDWDRFAWPEAIALFARGLGAAHLGKIDEAKAIGARLGQLEAATRKALDRFEQGDIDGGLEILIDGAGGPGTWKNRSDSGVSWRCERSRGRRDRSP